jgi:uncharacterized NAD(P)/FAD-binding protein YdhS
MDTFAVIGSGFSGTMIAAHLLRSGAGRVVLIERSGRFGRGVAYGTTCASHVLNVPAGRMSAFEDDGDHFLRWARERDSAVQGGSFLPRMVYGEYLESVLRQAETAAPGAMERCHDEALALREGRRGPGGCVEVVLRSGRSIMVDRVVLAIGNFAPADPPLRDAAALQNSRYLRDPWELPRYDTLDREQGVLLVGTGLTMIDVVLELAARGWRGPITAISRRGLLPQPHRSPAKPTHPEPPSDLAEWEPTAKGMLRSLRAEVRKQARQGTDWREVVTSIRHDTAALWRSMPLAERRRFLDRLRAYWDTHRHRAAPQAWSAIEGMMRTGRLNVRAARLCALRPAASGLSASILPRGSGASEELSVGAVINCTGPETNLARIQDPLLRSLRDAGLIRTDELGLGLDADADGAVIGASGRPSSWLYAIGPLRRPQLWETTAVPELRIQAAELVRVLTARAGARVSA